MANIRNLMVQVKVMDGVHVHAAIFDMLDLAKRLDTGIGAEFNGHSLWVWPWSDPDKIEALFLRKQNPNDAATDITIKGGEK